MAKANETNETALAPAATGETATYPALAGEAAGVLDTIRQNLGGRDLRATDLLRIKVPTGGGLTWDLGDDDDEGEGAAKKLNAVILYARSIRAYWASPFSGAANPPDCSSDDGCVGYGDPGGDCSQCSLSKFGSKENGRGQACKQMKQVFILLPGSFLPMVLNVPPTSIKNFDTFAVKMGSRGLHLNAVVTELSLEKDKSGDGIEFSKIKFKKVGLLTPEMEMVAAALGASMMRSAAQPTQDDYNQAASY